MGGGDDADVDLDRLLATDAPHRALFHGTWHIVTSHAGALLLGRLLWGLAFQRHPGTLVLIEGPHLAPTPFDGDPPDPLLLVPAGLTAFDVDRLRALQQRLRRGAPRPTTIHWHTFGMPAALEEDPRDIALWCHPEHRAARHQERMSRRAGFVCYTAPPAILRAHALAIHRMGRAQRHAGYHPLAEAGPRVAWHANGEVQVIAGFDQAVSAATVGRREVLGAARTITRAAQRQAIYEETERARARLQRARAKPRGEDAEGCSSAPAAATHPAAVVREAVRPWHPSRPSRTARGPRRGAAG